MTLRILGIDPGLRHTGFGIIDMIKKNNLQYVSSGVITSDSSDNLDQRLKCILNNLSEIIVQYKPMVACIEKVFVNVNPQSTLALGQARGCAITTCVLHDLPVSEYTALQIKKTVVGYGHAEKVQLAKMVQYLLKLDGQPKADASDALATAITHAYFMPARNFKVAPVN